MPFFKKLLNPFIKTAGKVADKLHIKPLQKIVSYANTVLNGRDNYPPNARNVIEAHGSKKIKNMVIIRQPIQSFINKVFNGLTFGAFQKKLDELPYDDLFHLRMVVTLEDGTRVQIEKADVINVSTNITSHSRQENMEVPINKDLTLTDLLNGGQKVLGSNTFSYRAFGNNCQDYQMALLKGSNLDTPSLTTFVKQDTSELATLSPALVKVANAATDLGGKMNEIIKGTGIKKKHSKSHIVQSVTFDSKQWTVATARKWLSENGYISPKVDRKINRLRFRQKDPEELREQGYTSYTTHRLPKGIELIITYQSMKTKPVIGDGIHSIRAKGGELIHIDLNGSQGSMNSHNIKGNGMNFFTGKEQPRTSMAPPGFHGMGKFQVNGRDWNGKYKSLEGKAYTADRIALFQKRYPATVLHNYYIKDQDDGTGHMVQVPLNTRAYAEAYDRHNPQSLADGFKDAFNIVSAPLSLIPGVGIPMGIASTLINGGSVRSTQGGSVRSTQGGELVHDFHPQHTSNQTVPNLNFLESKVKSSNPLFNNIKTSDVRDLKGLFKQVEDRETKQRKTTVKQGKATKARVKREVKALKKMKPRNIKTRGSIESKKKALYKYIKI